MSAYQPPIADLAFALEHVVGYPEIANLPGFEHADLDTVVELLEQCGEFMAKVVAPTNRAGDVQGSHLGPDGTVATPEGFAEVYHQYVEAGWGSVPLPEEFGGGGFPRTVGLVIQELMTSA
ncbi:MAG: acyl-CoA dehydrogenase N-terminal domain-containing protein, partial [Specibacter sp.]